MEIYGQMIFVLIIALSLAGTMHFRGATRWVVAAPWLLSPFHGFIILFCGYAVIRVALSLFWLLIKR
jgi:cell division protein FtsX